MKPTPIAICLLGIASAFITLPLYYIKYRIKQRKVIMTTQHHQLNQESSTARQIQCLRCQFIPPTSTAAACPNCGSHDHFVDLPDCEASND